MGALGLNEQIAAESASKLTGGRVNYYLAQVDHPQREEQPAYQAECEDIIAALNMDFNEACEFKAIWRTAAARLGNGKPGQKELYDAEKRVHYANRSLLKARRAVPDTVPESDAWIHWTGVGAIPASTAPVQIQFRDGVIRKAVAGSFRWSLMGNDGDIVRYRLL